MPLILLDANMPIGLRAALPDQVVHTAFEMGWNTLENGDLLTAAELRGFAIMITGDQRIQYQQNLTSRKIALIVLDSNNWPTIQTGLGAVTAAVSNVTDGSYQTVTFERPKLKRRPKPTTDTCQT